MSRKQYPITSNWERTSREKYSGITDCNECDCHFSAKEKFWVRHIQVSYMRGDDETEVLCDPCKAEAEGETAGSQKEAAK